MSVRNAPRDMGASVRQRLLNQARAQGRPFQELLQYFAMERFLYRLSNSRFADRFVLKGALLLTAIVAEVCRIAKEPDGIEFPPDSVEARRIKEDADYEGVRSRFHATLAKAKIPMQIDIGFGDVIVPPPAEIEYPTLLEFPPPILLAYPKETVVAEKLEALTSLGLLNSRIKDYYDLALLARLYPFDGQLLVEAIRSTFRHRGIPVEPVPVGLTEEFSSDPARGPQWRAFMRRSRLTEEAGGLAALVSQVRGFAVEPLSAAARNDTFNCLWRAGGPWS